MSGGLLLGGREEIRGEASAGEAHSSASVMSFTRNISKLKLGRKTNHSSGFNGSRLPRLPISRKYLKLSGDLANGELAVSRWFDYLVADVACEMRWAG